MDDLLYWQTHTIIVSYFCSLELGEASDAEMLCKISEESVGEMFCQCVQDDWKEALACYNDVLGIRTAVSFALIGMQIATFRTILAGLRHFFPAPAALPWF